MLVSEKSTQVWTRHLYESLQSLGGIVSKVSFPGPVKTFPER